MGQVLTSHVEGGLAVQCVVLAEVVHGHGAAAIDGEIHHLVEGDQLHSVELPVVDRLRTGGRWVPPPQRVSFSWAHPFLDTLPRFQQLLPKGPHLSGGDWDWGPKAQPLLLPGES